MRVALLGPYTIDGREAPGWNAARETLKVFGRRDVLVHTGGNGIGMRIDSIQRRAKGVEKQRLPIIEVALPPLGGAYNREAALKLNAAHLLLTCDVIVYTEIDDEVQPVLDLHAAGVERGQAPYTRVVVAQAFEWIAERSERGHEVTA